MYGGGFGGGPGKGHGGGKCLGGLGMGLLGGLINPFNMSLSTSGLIGSLSAMGLLF